MSKMETEDKNEWMSNVMNRLYNLWSMEEVMATGHIIKNVVEVDDDSVHLVCGSRETADLVRYSSCTLGETEGCDIEDVESSHLEHEETEYYGNREQEYIEIVISEEGEHLSIRVEDIVETEELDDPVEDWSSIWSLDSVKPFTDSEGITLTLSSQGFIYDFDLGVFHKVRGCGENFCMNIAKGLRRNELKFLQIIKSAFDDKIEKSKIDDFISKIDHQEVSKERVPSGFDIRKALNGKKCLYQTIHMDSWKDELDIAA